MGLSDLVLVSPECEIDGQAIALAAGASDILHQARIVSDLSEAISDCRLVLGTSARRRNQAWTLYDPKTAAAQIKAQILATQAPAAVVFGRERTGMTNEELALCQAHLEIPANPEYSSLNLAMAVQLISYELRQAALASDQESMAQIPHTPLATQAELSQLFEQLAQALAHIGFLKPDRANPLIHKMKRLFQRAQLEENEVHILRGIFAHILKK